MDAGRFDVLVRSLASTRNRRSAIRLVGGTLALLGATSTDARHRPGKKCKRKCNGTCCAAGEVCVGGVCQSARADCPAGADSCSANGYVSCMSNSFCACYRRLEGGVRCVEFAISDTCGRCKTDADCDRLGFPRGSSCIYGAGDQCTCNSSTRKVGYCGEPCGWGNHTAAQGVAGPRR
jgi:hypothetical protein